MPSKNAQIVFLNWENETPHRGTLSCWTDGVTIWSYDMPILVHAGPAVLLNQRALTTNVYTEAALVDIRALVRKSNCYNVVEVFPSDKDCRDAGGLMDAYERGDLGVAPAACVEVTATNAAARKKSAIYQVDDEIGI